MRSLASILPGIAFRASSDPQALRRHRIFLICEGLVLSMGVEARVDGLVVWSFRAAYVQPEISEG